MTSTEAAILATKLLACSNMEEAWGLVLFCAEPERVLWHLLENQRVGAAAITGLQQALISARLETAAAHRERVRIQEKHDPQGSLL